MKEMINKHKFKIIILINILFLGIVGVSASIILASKEVSYDNTNSNMSSDNVQDAIDELYGVARLSERMDELEEELETTKSALKNYWKTVYPVGSIYFSTNDNTAAKVQERFGGTWVAYGPGKTLVGVNTSDTSFDAAEETGGAKTHSIAVGNLPAHNHPIPALSGSTTAANNVGQARSAGAHSHGIGVSWANNCYVENAHSVQWHGEKTCNTNNAGVIRSAGAHTHTLNIPSLTVSTNASNTNGCTNCSASALNTQDPYITVYMWKRTA